MTFDERRDTIRPQWMALGASWRIGNAYARVGITPTQAARMTDKELGKPRNIGPKTLIQVRAILEDEEYRLQRESAHAALKGRMAERKRVQRELDEAFPDGIPMRHDPEG